MLIFVPGVARAQASEVATARQLAISGIDLVESGNCKKGQPLLERAEELHHASVHLQYLARCRAASGHLVAATEMWRRIVREGAPTGSSPAVVKALTEATAKLEQTLPQLASTTLRTAAAYPNLVLSLDGTSLPPELVGASQVIDPGTHRLVARAPGYREWSKEWTLPAGGSAALLIDLGTPISTSTSTESPAPTEAPAKASSPPFGVIGWTTAAAGAVALVAGTVTLLSRNSRLNEFRSGCPNDVCEQPPKGSYTPQKYEDDESTIRHLTTASNILLFGGGTLIAGGVTLLVIGTTQTPKGQPAAALLAGAPSADGGLTFVGHW